MGSQFIIGESSESSKLIFLSVGKGDCMINGLKTKSKIYLLPSKFKRRRFKVQQTCMKGPIKEIIISPKPPPLSAS